MIASRSVRPTGRPASYRRSSAVAAPQPGAAVMMTRASGFASRTSASPCPPARRSMN